MFLLRMIARWFGYLIINKKKNQLDVNMHLVQLFKHLNINCVVDVGANKGQYGMGLRENGYKGFIFSFEPVMENYLELVHRCKNDPMWSCFHYALGREESKKTINITRDSVFSSFLHPSIYAESTSSAKVQIDKTEEVPIRRLDAILPDLLKGMENPRIFLKMDTQGYDLEVLNGAGTCIQDMLALQSEISILPLYNDMPDYISALSAYKKLGFEVSGFYPIGRDPHSYAIVEFDCVMVKVKK